LDNIFNLFGDIEAEEELNVKENSKSVNGKNIYIYIKKKKKKKKKKIQFN